MSRRRAFTLTEIAAAAVMLAVMLSVCLQLIRATGVQRRGLWARQAAMQEAANVMERLCARPWEELTPEAAGEFQLSEQVPSAASGAQLVVEVGEPEKDAAAESLEAKRIAVVVRWPAERGQRDRSVRLVAWKYRRPAQ
jgi:Tfp pilus assembly protein PilE